MSGQDALLHAGAAGGGDHDQRAAPGDGGFDRARHLFAHHRAHAAAHEEEIHHRERDRLAADRGDAGERRVLHPGVLLRQRHALGVALLRVAELERVAGFEVGEAFLERVGIDQELEIGAGRNAEMVVAVRAGPGVLLEHGLEQGFAAALALGPQTFGHVLAALPLGAGLDAASVLA
jgi:hypothetical protein